MPPLQAFDFVVETFRPVAIIHWGGSFMRGKVSLGGDVDVLIVVEDSAELHPEDLARLKKKFKKFDLDPYAIRRRDLKKKLIAAMGPHGPYEMHELIHYQLKHESEVIYGDKNIRRIIRPMLLKNALKEIVPYIRDVMMPRVEKAMADMPPAQFIAQQMNAVLVIVRTIYSVEQKKLATKEDALEYLAQRHPPLKKLCGFLLKKYKGKTAKSYAGFRNDMEKLFALTRRACRKF